MLKFLVDLVKPQISQVYHISRGIDSKTRAKMTTIQAENLSKKIQGEPFSRERIANLVSCSSDNKIVKQKAQWLQEFILDEKNQSDEWVLELLENITGERAITANTKLDIKAAEGNYCLSFTCFKRLQVPTEHVNCGSDDLDCDDKQKFFNNLTLTLSQKSFDMR